MYYEDDFYEPSEFDQQVEEFKQALRESIKSEIRDELDRLRTENNSLKDVKANVERFEREQQKKINELEQEIRGAKQAAKRERLAELLSSVNPVMYMARCKYEKGPKCDKCNAMREITYKTPLGRDAQESCVCATETKTWIPESYIANEMKINRYGDQNPLMRVWYVLERALASEDDNLYSVYRDRKYDGEDFGKVDVYKTLFDDIADCQKFCDWLNMNKK